ncbi:hypothetical protein C1646_731247 [Rhizophagus diaphanus]|nr:hypothetical protein C1646_731247 [Rhizophagus diaphanus] [Rhizophagus sp. MUCL 43196]
MNSERIIMSYSLNCLVLGQPIAKIFNIFYGELFFVGVGMQVKFDDLTVAGFKQVLSEKCQITEMNVWKVKLSFNEIENISEEDDIKNRDDCKKIDDNPMLYFKNYYNADDKKPEPGYLHIFIVPTSDTPNKRIKLQDEKISVGDVYAYTTEYLKELLSPFDEPVNCDNVDSYFNAPLKRKLIAPPYLCEEYPDYFDQKDLDLLTDVLLAVGDAMELYTGKDNQEMETSYMVDNVIRKMVKLAIKYIGQSEFEWARNNKMNDWTTTTHKKKVRPDVLIYCSEVLVIMGEEKADNSTFATAAEDLDDYFKFWNTLAFGELPLVFAFAAVGSRIQFYYFHQVISSTTPKRDKLGNVLSLGTEVKMNNYLAIKSVINIIRIIMTFKCSGFITTPRLKLFKIIHRKNGNAITIQNGEIRKSIKVENIMDLVFHSNLYTRILKEHYEHITYKESRGKIYLTYGPVGYLCTPKTEDELRYAIGNILEIVSKLHKEGVVHRDIRWDNVVKLKDDKWLLIDFEEAAKIGDERETLIISAPEYANGIDTCQASGDIWMIGKLMDEVKFTLSEKAQNFRNKLMIDDFNLRLTATDALKDDWIEEMDDSME